MNVITRETRRMALEQIMETAESRRATDLRELQKFPRLTANGE